MDDQRRRVAVSATLRVLAGLFAALVVIVGFFDGAVWYALAVGAVVGIAFAVVGYFRDGVDTDRFGHA